MPQRLLTSSTAAASEYWASYDNVDRELEEGWDEDLVEERVFDKPLVSRLAALAEDNLTEDLARLDTKYKLLLTQLRLLWKEEHAAKIIVFSSFKPTLRYLRRRLVDDGISNELLHGSVRSLENRSWNVFGRATRRFCFRQKSEAKVSIFSSARSW